MFRESLPLLSSLFLASTLHGASILNPSFEDGLPVGQEDAPFYSETAPTGWTNWSRLENTSTTISQTPMWTHATRSGFPQASDGSYFVNLSGYGAVVAGETPVTHNVESGIRTTVSGLTVGYTYTVSVDAANVLLSNRSVFSSDGFLDAYVGGVGSTLVLNESLSITDQLALTTGGQWESASIGTYSFSFTATAEEMDIGFRARLNDATGDNLGRRFDVAIDNVTIAVPEPSSVMIAGLAAAGALVRRRRI